MEPSLFTGFGLCSFEIFEQVSEFLTSEAKHRGCLAVNTICDVLSSEEALAESIRPIFDSRRELFEKIMSQAREQEELPAETDVVATANLLLSFMCGFSVFS